MANEFKIISEDGLKMLCKAIQKVSTVGEILDDTNSVTDKTYSSFEIDKRLNTKVDKTQLTTVLDETVTDEQVPSAKAVVDGLKNINDFNVQVVKETLDLNDITETGIYFFPQEYTPVNIPVGVNGWLLVMKGSVSHVVKQVWYRQGTTNVNTHNTFERYRGGDTWSEWTRFLTEKDYYSALDSGNTVITQNSDLNDYLTPGVYTCIGNSVAKTLTNCPHVTSNFKLIVNKNTGGNNGQFFGYQMIVGTLGSNPVRDVCVYYRGVNMQGNARVFSKWKTMSGSTVKDVSKTQIISSNPTDFSDSGNAYYTVLNGVCHVNLWGIIITNSGSKVKTGAVLPKPLFNGTGTFLTGSATGTPSGFAYVEPHDCILTFDNAETNQHLFGTFSYPVAEE